ncbi:MAG TPA: thermonuclease family protein [Actinomycetota bacterium]|nr:thermonuclease family protein [Actinomycetota bacterium]
MIDGDTIEVARGGTLDVRLIGIDTPETVHPHEPVQCYGPAASAFTTRALEGDSVRLEFDVERRDAYGRALAYVWEDGRLFNQLLVQRGFATVATFPPNVRYVDRLVAAQRRARRADRGLWGACGGRASGGGGSRGASVGTATRGTGGNCDPNYRGACVPRYPPDLDCDRVPSGFTSIGSDPHGFDGDGDGVACE